MGLGAGNHRMILATPAASSLVTVALTAFVVALSLVVQLFAMPFQQAMAGPALPERSDTPAIAADLKAVFGDAAGFCAHMPATRARRRRTAPAIIATTNARCAGPPLRPTAFLPARCADSARTLNAIRHAIGAAPDFGAFPACPAQRNRARAPPLAV